MNRRLTFVAFLPASSFCSLGVNPASQQRDQARKLAIPNATHNNTRGFITRRLEEELIRTANGLARNDRAGLEAVLAKQDDLRVLNRVLNLVASALLAHDDLELVLLGGTASKGSPDLSGPLTEHNLADFRADLAFVGADALDERGFYTGIQEIANVSRAMIASAQRTILVADSSKFGKNAFVRIAGWVAIDHVIVDDELPKQVLTWVGKSIRNHTLVSFNIDEQS